ncbi:MAG: carbohydrate-binding domain-containing protein, partial [Bacteroides sp.]|nr:carbohydrate-binding domain-containing protein [Bacteroides sp.]
MNRKIISGILGIAIAAMSCSGCGNTIENSNPSSVTDTLQELRGDEIPIRLADGAITAGNHLVNIEEKGVTITGAGTYVVTGQLSDGYIVVDADKEDTVVLVLNGVDITCSDYAPIRILQAGEVTIYLAENTQNHLTDGKDYALENEDDNTDGVIFSKDDLKFDGEGILYINGNYKHGIVGKDDLVIQGGTYIIQAEKDGINVNDSIVIEGGCFTITAGSQGMHVDEILTVNDGEITIAESNEGLEGHQVIINGGVLDITASDDGINSNSGSASKTEKTEGTPAENQDGKGMELPQGEPPDGVEPGEGMPQGKLPDGVGPEEGMPQGELPDGIEPGERM